jgi:esterase/lipase superfamily enzyme
MIFSWPSQDTLVRYLPDTTAAENSEYALHDFLHLVASAAIGREVDVMAHSHGNKLLVRSLCSDKRTSTSENALKRLILVEPDVDQEFLRQRAASLAAVSEQIIIYHSRNDRALALAAFLFDSKALCLCFR